MADERLMSIKELAEYLQLDLSTLYLWSQQGEISAMKLGKVWRYRRSEVDDWLDRRRNRPVGPEMISPLAG